MELRTILVFLGFASIGALYFILYRAVFFSRLKWKMIHSIYIPIIVSIFSVTVFLSVKDLDGFAAIAGAISLIILNAPVVVYLILLIVFGLLDARKKKRRTL